MILSMDLNLSINKLDPLLSASSHGQSGAIREPPLFPHVLVLRVMVPDAPVRQADLGGSVFVALLGLSAGSRVKGLASWYGNGQGIRIRKQEELTAAAAVGARKFSN